MIKDFRYYTAWTDAMKYENGYAGLIGYQSKDPDAVTRVLWVIAPNFLSEGDAERSADRMLEQIEEINCFGRVMYADGVML
jgi:hypothetical protein